MSGIVIVSTEPVRSLRHVDAFVAGAAVTSPTRPLPAVGRTSRRTAGERVDPGIGPTTLVDRSVKVLLSANTALSAAQVNALIATTARTGRTRQRTGGELILSDTEPDIAVRSLLAPQADGLSSSAESKGVGSP